MVLLLPVGLLLGGGADGRTAVAGALGRTVSGSGARPGCCGCHEVFRTGGLSFGGTGGLDWVGDGWLVCFLACEGAGRLCDVVTGVLTRDGRMTLARDGEAMKAGELTTTGFLAATV